MNSQTYRFKVGGFHCIAVSDGTHTYAPPTFPPPAIFLFANAPKEQLEQALREHDLQPEHWTEWVSPYICLVIDTGEHRVLVDTGAGNLAPSTGKLLQNLQAVGIARQDIDTVILTHGHPDHIGGNTDSEGKLVFSKAKYIMWKNEWDFWNSEEATLKLDEHVRGVLVGYARKNLPPIQRQLSLVDSETEVLPGIQAIAAPGHTPGQIALAISSKGEQLLCVSDVVLHPIHLEWQEWCAAIDFDPGQVEGTRRRIMNRATVDNALVLAFHFPFPGLGHILQKEKAWQWMPMGMTQ
jgi:glyoxylase-like metal-dependent hydrolase (beta-lactamase superfamily II)